MSNPLMVAKWIWTKVQYSDGDICWAACLSTAAKSAARGWNNVFQERFPASIICLLVLVCVYKYSIINCGDATVWKPLPTSKREILPTQLSPGIRSSTSCYLVPSCFPMPLCHKAMAWICSNSCSLKDVHKVFSVGIKQRKVVHTD